MLGGVDRGKGIEEQRNNNSSNNSRTTVVTTTTVTTVTTATPIIIIIKIRNNISSKPTLFSPRVSNGRADAPKNNHDSKFL